MRGGLIEILKYVPATVAAVVMLAIVAHAWFVDDTTPSKTLVGAILALVLAPLASRIKIFELLDFRTKVDRLDGELADARKDIATVSNSVQTLQFGMSVASRQDQVVNVNLAETMNPALIQERADAASEEVLREEDEENPFVLSPAFRMRWYLVDRLKVTIGEIAAALYVIYGVVEVFKNGSQPDQAGAGIDLTLSDLITYFRENKSLRAGAPVDEEDMDFLQRLEDLEEKTAVFDGEAKTMMRDRDQLLDQSNVSPDAGVIREHLNESQLLKAYIFGSAFAISSEFAKRLRPTLPKACPSCGVGNHGDNFLCYKCGSTMET